jgi:hypothetical protein
MLSKLEPLLAQQGIIIKWALYEWDATRNDETAKLIDNWFALASDSDEYLVCISNFSGALIDAGMFDDFKPCLEQILARLHDKKSTLIWIEPTSSTTKKRLLPKVKDFFRKRVPWFLGDKKVEALTFEYSMENPLIRVPL